MHESRREAGAQRNANQQLAGANRPLRQARQVDAGGSQRQRDHQRADDPGVGQVAPLEQQRAGDRGQHQQRQARVVHLGR